MVMTSRATSNESRVCPGPGLRDWGKALNRRDRKGCSRFHTCLCAPCALIRHVRLRWICLPRPGLSTARAAGLSRPVAHVGRLSIAAFPGVPGVAGADLRPPS